MTTASGPELNSRVLLGRAGAPHGRGIPVPVPSLSALVWVSNNKLHDSDP